MPPALENPFVLWLLLVAALAGLSYAFIRKELRARAILYGAFLLGCLAMIWPPMDWSGKPGRIRLGLDLRGGMHLVLQVVIDDACNQTLIND
jgi:preprotein translocase subunit SecD